MLTIAGIVLPTGSSAQGEVQPIELPSGLISQALQIDQASRGLLESTSNPVGPQTSVYIENGAPGLQLLQITLQIDTANPIVYNYGLAESNALQAHHLHRLASVPIAPGRHSIYVEYIARYPGDRSGTPRLRSRLTQTFEQPPSGNAIQVTLGRQSLGREPALAIRQWTPTPGGLDDADLRSIDLLLATGRQLRAASDLMNLQRQSGGALPPDFQQHLNQSLQALRLPSSVHNADNPAELAEFSAAAESADVVALDRVGQRDAKADPVALAIRDKANTALGFHLLDLQQAKAADDAFRRVRSPGPYSDAALLGLGWAQLAMLAKSATSARPSSPAIAVKTSIATVPSAFTSSWIVGDPKQLDALRRALVPWTELVGRDPTQAPVQEGMLAIPYALDHLGAHKQAQIYTGRAIDSLEHTLAHLDGALVHIQSGNMAKRVIDKDDSADNGWDWWYASLPEPRWWLESPPDAPDDFYFEALFRNDAFRTQADNCHRIYLLQRLVDRDQKRVGNNATPELNGQIAALNAELKPLAETQRQLLARIATEQVMGVQRQTQNYLAEAYFAMARFNDRPPNAVGH